MDTITTIKKPAKRENKSASECVTKTSTPNPSESIKRLSMVMPSLVSKGISTKMLHAVTALYLGSKDGMSMGELSLKIGVSSAAFTGVADGIERIGLATRTTNTNDRRSTKFKLTEGGLLFVEWLSSSLDSGSSPQLDGLPI
jgi:DNA-binding MarR family transcriptional regulator